MTMGVILPQTADKFKALEDQIGEPSFAQTVTSAHFSQIHLFFPKFKIESQASLKIALQSLGINEAFFECVANFGNVSDCNELFVSDVMHKAFVEVNEEGTEAAAATAIPIGINCSPQKFRASHPFMFFIKDDATGAIVFMGRLMNPKQ